MAISKYDLGYSYGKPGNSGIQKCKHVRMQTCNYGKIERNHPKFNHHAPRPVGAAGGPLGPSIALVPIVSALPLALAFEFASSLG